MMTYDEFKEKVVESVRDKLTSAELKTMKKNNDVSQDGITFYNDNENCTPFIHLDDLYKVYLATQSMDIVVNIVMEIAKTGGEIDVRTILGTWEEAMPRLALRLINTKWNLEFLKDKPHKNFLDLSIVVYMDLLKKRDGVISLVVDNGVLQFWGIDKVELFRAAYENLMKEEFSICDMEEVIQRLRGEEVKPTKYDGCNYVLTNEAMTFGARGMLRKDLLMEFAEKENADLFVLPNSINDVILTPKREGLTEEVLKDMINIIQVFNKPSADSLSESLYYFDRKTEEISIYHI